jgi:hypothetical protein
MFLIISLNNLGHLHPLQRHMGTLHAMVHHHRPLQSDWMA